MTGPFAKQIMQVNKGMQAFPARGLFSICSLPCQGAKGKPLSILIAVLRHDQDLAIAHHVEIPRRYCP